MESIRKCYGFPNEIDVSANGSKGLSIGWKDNVSIQLKSFSCSHIDVKIQDEGDLGDLQVSMVHLLSIKEAHHGIYYEG